MLNDKDKTDIVAALRMFADNHCMTADCRIQCGELIKKVETIATLDPQTAARLAGSPSTHAHIPCRWKVGATLRNKRHGWEGVIVSQPQFGCNGLINVDVGCGIKVGEHVSDWDYVCGPDGETEEGYLSR